MENFCVKFKKNNTIQILNINLFVNVYVMDI